MGIKGFPCPNLAKAFEHPCLLNEWCLCYGKGWILRGSRWLPELPRRLSTELFEKGINRFCCPAVCCLFSVPCPGWLWSMCSGWSDLISTWTHPQPPPGSPNPSCEHAPLWAFTNTFHSDWFLMQCTCVISNSLFSIAKLLNPFHVWGSRPSELR